MQELEKTELSEVLQIGTVDAGNDTLFAKAQKFPFSTTHLTLIVGVGGSGAAAITEAIKTARQKLDIGFQQYVKFILLDSATNEIERLQRLIGRENLVIINSSENGMAENLRPEVRPDFYKKMIPGDYDISKLADLNGSGQSRLTGRIKFYYDKNGSYVDAILRDTIAGFYHDGGWAQLANLPVDVMILAGLSGGTGSGTFIDVAAHVRYALKHANQNVDARMFGYLFLSDTVTEWEPEVSIKNTLHANCYAALKELESFMSIPALPSGAKVSFSSRDNVTRFDVDALNMLFDYPVLINGSYRESKTMMAECIVNMIAANTGQFDQNSFYSNTPQARATFLNKPDNYIGGLLSPDFRPEDSHRYSGIGYAYAAIPEQIITSNIVSAVCRKLYIADPTQPQYKFCTEKSRMSRTEMEKELRTLCAFNDKQITDANYWEQKLKSMLEKLSRLDGNQVDITEKEVRLGQINTYDAGFKADEKLTEAKEGMKKHLLGLKTAFEEGMYTVMEHFGPRAIEYLYDGKGPDDKDGKPQLYPELSIREMLAHCRTELKKIIGNATKGQLPGSEVKGGVLEFLTKRGLGEWKSAYKSAKEYQNMQKLAESMLETGGMWETIIEDSVLAYVDKSKIFAGRIEQLNDFYYSQGSSLEAEDYQTFVTASNADNCVNLCTDGYVYQWVQGQVRQKINSIDIGALKRAFVNSFKADPDVWTSAVPGRTRAEYDKVVAEVCQVGRFSQPGAIELNATAYFDHVLAGVAPAVLQQEADAIVSGIVQRLLTKSKPSIKVNENGNRVVNRFALLPQSLQASPNKTAIVNAFTNAWGGNNGAQNNGVQNNQAIAFSPAVSDIVCYQTSVANGLCDLTDIDMMERCYDHSNDPTIHLADGQYDTAFREMTKTELSARADNGQGTQNIDLNPTEDKLFGTGLSLRHYPSVGTTCMGKEQEYMENVFKPVVRYAQQEKLIEVRPKANGASQYDYEFLMRVIPDDWKNLDVTGYTQTDSIGMLARGQALFAYLRQQNPLSQQEAEVKLTLTGSGAFDYGFDFTQAQRAENGRRDDVIYDTALNYMMRVLRRNTYRYKQLRKTLSKYYDIDRVLKEVEKPLEYRAKAHRFTDHLLHGAVTFEKDNWMYLMDDKGTKAAFCKLDYAGKYFLKDKEKRFLKDGLGFLIAALKSESISVDLEKIIGDMMVIDPKGMEKLANSNKGLIRQYLEEIDEIQRKYPTLELGNAFRKVYDLDENDAYILLLTALKEEFDKVPPAVPEDLEKPAETWDCPKCGLKGLEQTVKFCPECGAKRPEPQIAGTWDCPSCGLKGLKQTVKFCPECGNPQPGLNR